MDNIKKTKTIIKRDQAIDVLRILSILAVIAIHTSTRTLEMTHLNITQAPISLVINQVSRFAVPLFFLVSGFVLELNYRPDRGYGEYLRKRGIRILIPYIFWSAIYYFFVYRVHSSNLMSVIFSGAASYQLYFIPSLLILYMIYPLLHLIYKVISNKWFLILLSIGEVLFLYNDYYGRPIDIYFPVSVALLNLLPFVLGIVAARNNENIIKLANQWKLLLAPLVAVLAGIVTWEGRSRYLATYNYEAIYSQWRPSVLFYTIDLFGWLYFVFSKIKLPKDVINTLSKLSFFVFFVHVIWLEVFWNIAVQYIYKQVSTGSTWQWWFDVLFMMIVSTISFFSAFIVHKIPKMEKITG